jgi:hypothetical protein
VRTKLPVIPQLLMKLQLKKKEDKEKRHQIDVCTFLELGARI